jgi:hypothetical protein
VGIHPIYAFDRAFEFDRLAGVKLSRDSVVGQQRCGGAKQPDAQAYNDQKISLHQTSS